MLKTVLEQDDYEIIEASDGNEGSQMYREHSCDLIITDICMPNKDGNELIEELKTELPEVKIIAISGKGFLEGEHVLEIAKHLGADHTIKKPMKINQLLTVIKEMLNE